MIRSMRNNNAPSAVDDSISAFYSYYPSRHDWKIVDWDVKPQHNQNFYSY